MGRHDTLLSNKVVSPNNNAHSPQLVYTNSGIHLHYTLHLPRFGKLLRWLHFQFETQVFVAAKHVHKYIHCPPHSLHTNQRQDTFRLLLFAAACVHAGWRCARVAGQWGQLCNTLFQFSICWNVYGNLYMADKGLCLRSAVCIFCYIVFNAFRWSGRWEKIVGYIIIVCLLREGLEWG